jgi:hypothetical protein
MAALSAIVALWAGGGPQGASAAPGSLLFKLAAPDPQPGAKFGAALTTIDGDILVSEPNRFHPDTGVGRAYLFDGTTGEFQFALSNPEVGSQDSFAAAVAGGDGRLFVSAIGLEERVYVFSAADGQWLNRIDDPNGPLPGTLGALSGFGTGVAYGGGSLSVSAPSFGLSRELQSVGQTYVFNGASGELEHVLSNPEPKRSDTHGVGSSLAVLDDKVIVGAMLDDLPGDDRPDGDNPGRVWAFDRNSGDALFTIENPNPESRFLDWFGWSVAASEEVIVVGAREDGMSGVDGSGTVYVFDSRTGDLLHTLFSPQLETNGEFGRSVAVTPGGDIVVGAWGTSVEEIEAAGHVYVFDGLTGRLLVDIPNPEPAIFAEFGWSVAALQDRIVIGSRQANADGLSAPGAVYIYSTVPEGDSLTLAKMALIGGISWRASRTRNPRLII